MAAWIRAARPAGLVTVVLLLLLGETIAVAQARGFSAASFWLLLLYGLIIHLAVAFSIEQADSDVGRRRRIVALFSSIAVGRRPLGVRALPVDALRLLIPILGGAALLVSGGLWILGGSWHTLVLTAFLIVLVWLCEHPPLRLTFAGGGEMLYGIAGAALPLVAFAAHAGTVGGFPWRVLLVTVPALLALVIGVQLPGRDDDRDVERRSLVALVGHQLGQITVLILLGVAVAFLGFGSAFGWDLEVRLLSVALPSLFFVFTLFSFFAEQGFALHIRFVRLSVVAFGSIMISTTVLLLIA